MKTEDVNDEANKKRRMKRQADLYEYTPTKTRCPLLLVADYRFFQEMGAGNTKTTINYLVVFFIFFLTFFLKIIIFYFNSLLYRLV